MIARDLPHWLFTTISRPGLTADEIKAAQDVIRAILQVQKTKDTEAKIYEDLHSRHGVNVKHPEKIDLSTLHDEGGNTALIHAARHGYREIVQTLITEVKVSVDVKNNQGDTALAEAAMGNHVEIIRSLVNSGATLNSLDFSRATPLLKACLSTRTEESAHFLITQLREKKESLDRANTYGFTPLLLAAKNNLRKTVAYLIEAGASITARTFNNETVLGFTCITGDLQNATKLIQMLKEKRDQEALDSQCNEGYTPLSLTILYGHDNIIAALLDAEVSVNIKSRYEDTPLLQASTQTPIDPKRIEKLITAGADLTAFDRNLRTALIMLSRQQANANALTAITLLITKWKEQGKSLDIYDQHRLTALNYAISLSAPDTAVLLLQAGANPNTNKIFNCLDKAVENNTSPLLVRILILCNAKTGNLKALEHFLESEKNISTRMALLGKIAMSHANLKKAKEYYNKITSSTRSSVAFHCLGEWNENQNDLYTAAAQYRDAVMMALDKEKFISLVKFIEVMQKISKTTSASSSSTSSHSSSNTRSFSYQTFSDSLHSMVAAWGADNITLNRNHWIFLANNALFYCPPPPSTKSVSGYEQKNSETLRKNHTQFLERAMHHVNRLSITDKEKKETAELYSRLKLTLQYDPTEAKRIGPSARVSASSSSSSSSLLKSSLVALSAIKPPSLSENKTPIEVPRLAPPPPAPP